MLCDNSCSIFILIMYFSIHKLTVSLTSSFCLGRLEVRFECTEVESQASQDGSARTTTETSQVFLVLWRRQEPAGIYVHRYDGWDFMQKCKNKICILIIRRVKQKAWNKTRKYSKYNLRKKQWLPRELLSQNWGH